ncbi:hypothetical protein ABIF73_000877 [Bradyrhizobium japonicum]|uniref:hypothetical protein n=1 Tax=Bradyrhizobium japonicum TaxID=375 RepID=UPI003397F220
MWKKEPLVHYRNVFCDGRLKVHMRYDIAFNINAGRDFDQLKAIARGLEHGALRHEQCGTTFLYGERGIVADLLDRFDELAMPAFADNAELAVLETNLEPAGSESTAENDLAGVLANIDETADADNLVAKTRDVDVARGIDFRE